MKIAVRDNKNYKDEQYILNKAAVCYQTLQSDLRIADEVQIMKMTTTNFYDDWVAGKYDSYSKANYDIENIKMLEGNII